ncbi:MAG: urea transporter permease subunit UrtB, partial [Proteobacteria bacterium]|nr:urea transporter permease subunit UrtB [Pseudomonadota bacterium]
MLWLIGMAPAAQALDAAAVQQLAAEDSDIKLAAINKLVASGDAAAIPVFKAMQDDVLQVYKGRVVISTDTGVRDAVTGQAIDIAGDAPESIVINNRIRGALDSAMASLKLLAPDRAERLVAAKAVAMDANAEMLPLIQRAVAQETDAEVKALLAQASAAIELKSPDAARRRQAIQQLALSENPQTKQMLGALLEKGVDGVFAEPDAGVRDEARKAIAAIDSRFVLPQVLGTLFYGLSLGSVLLLAALGLAITFGLMGIINMAHGEMLMIGAYT